SRAALHELVDRLPDGKLDQVFQLLEPEVEWEDEELSPSELQAIADFEAGRIPPGVVFTREQIEALIEALAPAAHA
ncbi:MAG: hypothetical protein ACKVVT_06870, partial [Dehalococcoidia bacterium]